jgi:hypothetical protein
MMMDVRLLVVKGEIFVYDNKYCKDD